MINFTLFLTTFSLVLAITALAIVKPNSARRWGVSLVVAATLLLACFFSFSLMADGENIAAKFLTGAFLTDRTGLVTFVAAVFAGFLCGLGLRLPTDRKTLHVARWGALAISVGCMGLLAAKDIISPYLANPNSASDQSFLQSEAAEGWAVRKVLDLSIFPTAVAVMDESRLVVAGYSGAYMQNGAVGMIELCEQGAAEYRSLASGMTRPHGIAVHEGAVYVSRSGQYSKAINGQLVSQNTGAITKLEDLRGDGSFGFYTDVVSDLPGAQLPDPLHQNNGIAFGSDGKLYITVGAPTDHQVPITQSVGSILCCNADGSGLRVFAEGFRNPYGICTNQLGQVFCTDNDAVVDEKGDKLFEVIEDANHGHPYNMIEEVKSDLVSPLIRMLSAQGIDYVEAFAEESLGDSLLVACYAEDAIQVVSGVSDGKQVEVKFFASVPTPVDVCITSEGRVFAVSYSDKALFEIVRVDVR